MVMVIYVFICIAIVNYNTDTTFDFIGSNICSYGCAVIGAISDNCLKSLKVWVYSIYWENIKNIMVLVMVVAIHLDNIKYTAKYWIYCSIYFSIISNLKKKPKNIKNIWKLVIYVENICKLYEKYM